MGKEPVINLHMPRELAAELYTLWVNSNYVATPYGNPLMLEPYYVRDDFIQLSALDAWHRAKADKKHSPPPPTKRITFDDIGGE